MLDAIQNALIAAFLLVSGAGASTAPPAPAPNDATRVEIAAPVVDQAILDDAYISYEAMNVVPNQDVPLVLDYVRTEDARPAKVATVWGEFVVPSVGYPGKFHVMRYSRIYGA